MLIPLTGMHLSRCSPTSQFPEAEACADPLNEDGQIESVMACSRTAMVMVMLMLMLSTVKRNLTAPLLLTRILVALGLVPLSTSTVLPLRIIHVEHLALCARARSRVPPKRVHADRQVQLDDLSSETDDRREILVIPSSIVVILIHQDEREARDVLSWEGVLEACNSNFKSVQDF